MQLRMAAAVAAVGMILTWGVQVERASAWAVQAGSTTAVVTAENLESAKTYFDRGRRLGSPAAGQGQPYLLRATFTTRASSGKVETGTYTDTWLSDTRWRREAVLGQSRFVRSRDGKKWYRLDDGPDAAVLQFVLTAMEPIPATERFAEPSWKVERGEGERAGMVRVSHGRENADGTPDPKRYEGFWFDSTGQLVASRLNGLELKRSKFEDFNGVHVARQIDVAVAGKVGMRIDVTDLQPVGDVDSRIFKIKGNIWLERDGSEVR
jgi:hypothetical protein